ncbi:unnamed protein product [Larinioides sclopetarius]|uniref:Uncharacterized protein n=1 Tax=Larinioides sclopetarius TaxID=280406 RepID=A0AAV1YTQ5_9ARAC
MGGQPWDNGRGNPRRMAGAVWSDSRRIRRVAFQITVRTAGENRDVSSVWEGDGMKQYHVSTSFYFAVWPREDQEEGAHFPDTNLGVPHGQSVNAISMWFVCVFYVDANVVENMHWCNRGFLEEPNYGDSLAPTEMGYVFGVLILTVWIVVEIEVEMDRKGFARVASVFILFIFPSFRLFARAAEKRFRTTQSGVPQWWMLNMQINSAVPLGKTESPSAQLFTALSNNSFLTTKIIRTLDAKKSRSIVEGSKAVDPGCGAPGTMCECSCSYVISVQLQLLELFQFQTLVLDHLISWEGGTKMSKEKSDAERSDERISDADDQRRAEHTNKITKENVQFIDYPHSKRNNTPTTKVNKKHLRTQTLDSFFG